MKRIKPKNKKVNQDVITECQPRIGDIPRRTSDGGFGIAGVNGSDLDATFSRYARQTGILFSAGSLILRLLIVLK